MPDFTNLALGMVLDSDATVADDGTVVGDPTEAALVVLAAKLGVDAEETRRAYPRLAEVPFDSEYKFMATFHRAKLAGRERVIAAGQGRPRRRARTVRTVGWSPERRRTCRSPTRASTSTRPTSAWASRDSGCWRSRPGSSTTTSSTPWRRIPMSLTQNLDFVGMVGIIDPLRAEAKDAVHTALGAGIDVRMITGDHAVTAEAIGEELGLGPGAISGSELQALSDDELAVRLPEPPRVRSRLARGQAPPRPRDAGAGPRSSP